MDPDGDLDLEALTVLVPGSPPRPADAMDMGEGLGDLDLEALQVLAPPPRVDRHGAAHMAAMRQCLAKKRLERAREEVNAEKNKAADAMSLVAVLAPSAARAAGLPVRKRLKAGVDISAPLGLALMRVAFAVQPAWRRSGSTPSRTRHKRPCARRSLSVRRWGCRSSCM